MTKTAAQLNREIAAYFASEQGGGGRMGGKRHVAHVGFGTMSKSKIPVRVKTRDNPAARTADERAIHPESFAALDRHGKILGTSHTMRGAMAKAADDKSYVDVRGEWTSDGTHWSVGKGRRVAVREGGKWIVG